MQIILKNENGSFEIGGGWHSVARLQEIAGLGPPAKEDTSIVFEGQPGRTLTHTRDIERTITMSLDFYGDERAVEKLFRIIYKSVTLWFYLGYTRRKITGRCINAPDITKIIYRKWQSIALQFVCDNPYFTDFYETEMAISKNIDQFPNYNENGEWYIQLPAIATLRSSESTIMNKGDIKVYPAITLKNNSQAAALADTYGVILTNLTTGKHITLNYDVVAGELVTIDLINRKITSTTNGDITNCMSDDTVLSEFYLEVGSNHMSINNLNESSDIFAVAQFSNQYISVVI